ncbi:NADH-quinone oxidoreductase subunit J [Aeromicrobium sp. Sec7.5]|uniref:NADH-quinone oxidoreductase subunit J n=1 Tax=Aeromicrobium sp. Sec7.5 TaxID=3121276 RepID=UPI002FE4F8BD
MTAFGVVAPIVVIAALGLLFARKAVHAALSLAVVMIGLAVLYAANGAPFLFAVQIIVYTGAIMMLFLFVVMLVGVESGPQAVTEPLPGHRGAAALVGLGFGAMLVVGIGQVVANGFSMPVAAVEDENVEGLAALMFGPYVLAFQFTAALLVTAVLGAMVLAHQERLTPQPSQAELAAQRIRDFGTDGKHPGNAPTPGVYARHNAVDAPALLPDGTPLESSVPGALVRRGQVIRPPVTGPGLGDGNGEALRGSQARTSGTGDGKTDGEDHS